MMGSTVRPPSLSLIRTATDRAHSPVEAREAKAFEDPDIFC